jgi:predicted DNA-binding transcriptional regulator YafY
LGNDGWPIQLGFMNSARVLTGWYELRQASRFSRTDRIVSAEVHDRYPARRPDLVRDFHTTSPASLVTMAGSSGTSGGNAV